MSENWRPPIEEVQRIDIAESDGREWVEVVMEVNQSGDMAEPFMMEWFPSKEDCTKLHDMGDFNTRVINPTVFDDAHERRYRLFAAIVGRLTLHE